MAAAAVELPTRIPTELPKFLNPADEAAGEPGRDPEGAAEHTLSQLPSEMAPAPRNRSPRRAMTWTAAAVGAVAALSAITAAVDRLAAPATVDGSSDPRWQFIASAAGKEAVVAAMARLEETRWDDRSGARAAAGTIDGGAPDAGQRLALGRSLIDATRESTPPQQVAPASDSKLGSALPVEGASEQAKAVPAPVIVRDLPAGSTLSVGTRLSDGVWLVEAKDLGEVVVTLPGDAPEQFRATIEALTSDGAAPGAISLQVRRTARLEPSSSASTTTGPDAAAPAESPSAREAPPPNVTPETAKPAVTPQKRGAGESSGSSQKRRASDAGAPHPRTVGTAQGAARNAAAARRPKAVAAAKPAQQPSPVASPYAAPGGKAPTKAKGHVPVAQKEAPQPSSASAQVGVPPSTLGGPPPDPPPPGPGWLLQFLKPE
jgi:hypothetical protein